MPDFSASVPVVEPAPPSPPAPPEPKSAFVPLALILGILIFSTARDVINLHTHLTTSRYQNAQSMDRLTKAGKESDLVQKLRDEILKLAPTDPAAARIKVDFFPQSTTIKSTAPDDSSQDKNP